jgi:guanylate kinase
MKKARFEEFDYYENRGEYAVRAYTRSGKGDFVSFVDTLEEAEKRLRLRDLSGEPTEKIKSTFARRLKENLNDYSKINEFAERYDAFVENSDLAECVDKICEYIDVLKNGDVPMSREEIRTISATLEKHAE